MSAVCQRFWWVDGKADTALGIRGQPSAYPSLFPSCHPSIYTIHLRPVKLSFSSQGQRGRDGMEKERWRRYWVVCKLCHPLNTALPPQPVTLTCFPSLCLLAYTFTVQRKERGCTVVVFVWKCSLCKLRCSYLRMVMSFLYWCIIQSSNLFIFTWNSIIGKTSKVLQMLSQCNKE